MAVFWRCALFFGLALIALGADSASKRRIVVFGDSLTEGGLAEGKSYTNFLQESLARKGYPYEVINQGISGDTTSGGLGRVGAAIAMKPDILILELGGNDGLRGIPVASSRRNLETMIQRLQSAGIRVLLAGMSLPPNYGPEYIRSFENMYQDLAKKYKIRLIPFLLSDVAAQLRQKPGLLNKDGIHPTVEGNRIVANTVLRHLEPMLRR